MSDLANATTDLLFEYQPSKEEEIARLTKKAAENTARIEAIMGDPTIAEFQRASKNLDKKMKEIEKLQSENRKLGEELSAVLLPEVVEPAEDGYYIYSKSEKAHSWQRKVSILKTNRSLFLKAMGYWFDLSNGANTSPQSDSWHNTFEDLLDIDRDTIEASITKLEDVSKFPTDLLGEIEGDYEKTGEEGALDDSADESDEDDE